MRRLDMRVPVSVAVCSTEQDTVSSKLPFGKDVQLPEGKWKIGVRTLEKELRGLKTVCQKYILKRDNGL